MTFNRMFLLMSFQCLVSVSAFSMREQLVIDEWDPPLYAKYANPQRRWILKALRESEPRNILDLGCGDGRITKYIADENPKATVIGLDISKNMIAHANKFHKRENLVFMVGDAEELLFEEKFDHIYSSSALHRLNNPEKAVGDIFNALNIGGKFIGTFPIKGSQLYTEALAAIDSKEKWKEYFPQKQRKDYAETAANWQKRFEHAGFTIGSIKTLARNEPFNTREGFREFLRSTSVYRSLLLDKSVEFFEEVVDEYLKKSPINEDGTITLQLTRVEIIAYKFERPKL